MVRLLHAWLTGQSAIPAWVCSLYKSIPFKIANFWDEFFLQNQENPPSIDCELLLGPECSLPGQGCLARHPRSHAWVMMVHSVGEWHG